MATNGPHPPPRDGHSPNPDWNVPQPGGISGQGASDGRTLSYTYAAPGGDPGLAAGPAAPPPGGGPAPGTPPQPGPAGAYPPPQPPGFGGPPTPPPAPHGAPPNAAPYPPPGPRPPYPPPGPGAPPRPPMPPQPYPPAANPLGAPGHARRRGGAGASAVIGGFLGVLAGIFVLVVIGASLIGEEDGPDTVSALPTPTFTFTPPTPAPYSPPNIELPNRETAGAREETEQLPTQVQRSPAVNRSLQNNSLYRAGRLPAVNCPAGSVNINSHAQVKSLFLRTARCMNRAWATALSRVGIPHRPPGYAIAAIRGRGACGDYPQRGSIVPYYCPRNTTIYASTTAMTRGLGNMPGYSTVTSWHGALTAIMAHEYGHHVQYLTGLTDGWWQQTLRASSQSTKLALSRRLELQATCLAGMFMRSAASTYPVTAQGRNVLYYFHSRVGDQPGYPRDHGTPANNLRWFRMGFDYNLARQCNTWRASAAAVS